MQGSDVNATDHTLSTPLHICTASGRDPSVLLASGANAGAINQKGFAVIHTAAGGGSVKSIELILERRPEDIIIQTEVPKSNGQLCSNVSIGGRVTASFSSSIRARGNSVNNIVAQYGVLRRKDK